MASNTCLYLWLSYITVIHFFFMLVHSDNYIIHMDSLAMPKAFASHHNWYLSTLSNALENPIASSKLIYSYTHVMNGFSATLSENEHEAIKGLPGYISSIPDSIVKLDTTHTPQFLGLNPSFGAWQAAKFGKDVIIGLVDSGVWPESESFNDNGMSEVPSKWKGQCENSIQFNSSLCNKKLIGAKFFNKGLLAKYPNINIAGLNSTRDTIGHGTLTATIAGGSQVDGASFFGYASGSATGIAPRSRIAVYKIVGGDSPVGFESDLLAAIDAAISDGVDVISLSLASDNVTSYEDPIVIASFAAMEKGIFVSASAGNHGPAHKTLHNDIPWVTTVAAGTLDRQFQATLKLDNGVSITGSSFYLLNISQVLNVPMVFIGNCDNVEKLAKVKSKIVVCDDVEELAKDQAYNERTTNIRGIVLISSTLNMEKLSNLTSNRFFPGEHSYPYIYINPKDGEIVKSYIKRNNSHSEAKASMYFKKTTFGVKPTPSVHFYSSRGPSGSFPFVLKPDITAPGSATLAAWPSNVPAVKIGSNNLFSNFSLLSGTSVACPHIAGVGALLKGAHSDWSPAVIRSAIMTTADIFDNTMEPIKDIGDKNKPATPLAMGAGHVNPNKALDPGLVYDVGVQDYVNLLCALNITQKNITVITRLSSVNCSNPSLDLNYPSFIAFFDEKNSSSVVVREFHRTVTNVAEGQTTYVAEVTPIEGIRVSVIPNKLVFKEKNEKLSYKLRIKMDRIRKGDEVAFGYLTWTDVKHVVRSPIVVSTLY